MYVYLISMNTSERLSRFDIEIYKVDYEERLTRTTTITKRIISRKYNTYVKSET
jgi:hypothetical protein